MAGWDLGRIKLFSVSCPSVNGTSFSLFNFGFWCAVYAGMRLDRFPDPLYMGHKDCSGWAKQSIRISWQDVHWPSSVGGKQQGPAMATLFFLFLLALALTPSSGTGVISGFFPNMNFKVFSQQGQHKDVPDHLQIKSLWTTTKVIDIRLKGC